MVVEKVKPQVEDILYRLGVNLQRVLRPERKRRNQML
jgi:hypothetical protein